MKLFTLIAGAFAELYNYIKKNKSKSPGQIQSDAITDNQALDARLKADREKEKSEPITVNVKFDLSPEEELRRKKNGG